MKKHNIFLSTLLFSSVFTLLSISTSFANTWKLENNSWKYYQANNTLTKSWHKIADNWYFFDTETGAMKTAWHKDANGSWYFLNPSKNADEGKMLTGWHWIDGYCYFFEPSKNHLEGKLITGQRTSDGYFVNADGRWVNEQNVPVYTPGKGFITTTTLPLQGTPNKNNAPNKASGTSSGKRASGGSGARVGGGGSGGRTGGSSGGSGGSSGSSVRPKRTKADLVNPTINPINKKDHEQITANDILNAVSNIGSGRAELKNQTLPTSTGTHDVIVVIRFDDGSSKEVTVRLTINQSEATSTNPNVSPVTKKDHEQITSNDILNAVSNIGTGRAELKNQTLPTSTGTHDIVVVIRFDDGSSKEVTVRLTISQSEATSTNPNVSPVNKKDHEQITANDILNAVSNIGTGRAELKNQTLPTSTGTHDVIVVIRFDDGSSKEVTVRLTISQSEATSTNPNVSPVNKKDHEQITANDILNAVSNIGSGRAELKNQTLPTSTGTHNIVVIIRFDDGSSKEVTVRLNINQSEATSTNPSVSPVTKKEHEEITPEDIFNAISNKGNARTSLQDETLPNSVGTYDINVTLTFEDNSTKIVTVRLNIEESIHNVRIEYVLDNSVKSFEEINIRHRENIDRERIVAPTHENEDAVYNIADSFDFETLNNISHSQTISIPLTERVYDSRRENSEVFVPFHSRRSNIWYITLIDFFDTSNPIDDRLITRIHSVYVNGEKLTKGDSNLPKQWQRASEGSQIQFNSASFVRTPIEVRIKAYGYNDIIHTIDHSVLFPSKVIDETESVMLIEYSNEVDESADFVNRLELYVNDIKYTKGNKNNPLEFEVDTLGEASKIFINTTGFTKKVDIFRFVHPVYKVPRIRNIYHSDGNYFDEMED